MLPTLNGMDLNFNCCNKCFSTVEDGSDLCNPCLESFTRAAPRNENIPTWACPNWEDKDHNPIRCSLCLLNYDPELRYSLNFKDYRLDRF